MSVFLKLFGGGSAAGSASRAIAKDRLSVILAAQRGSEVLEGVNLEELQRDVLAVVQVRIVVNVSTLVVLPILL
jgi:septum formation topological specificity factor MinE